MEEDCPVCGKTCDSQGLENHIRLTNGRGHGPAGSMPANATEGNDTNGETGPPIHAEDIRAHGPEREQTMSVQAALDRAVDVGGDEARRVARRMASMEQRIEGLEEAIESIQDRLAVKCPECGHDDPEPMVGEVAQAHAEYIGVHDWYCPECQNLFNAI